MSSSDVSQPKKMNLESMSISDHQKAKLKELFPEVFTEGLKVDFDQLKRTLGEMVDGGKERFGMQWAGKADCFKTIQQPSLATLVPCPEEGIEFDTTENVFIEGDNLEVLKLLQKSYLGKVKMIYIDPPYNTGNDFVYPDNYSENLDTYLEYTGQVDGSGRKFGTNVETDGRFHSKWMNMMYPRLFLAKNLLREDGVIFISIDDSEFKNLQVICDEIFGEENFIAKIIHKNNALKNQSKFIGVSTEYVLVYAKSINELKSKDDWKEKKIGASEIYNFFRKNKELGKTNEENLDLVKELYARPKFSHLSRWNKIDDSGLFMDDNLSREGGKKNYTIINPYSNESCPIPSRGWAKSYDELLKLQEENLIWYGDGTTPPRIKSYLKPDTVSVPDNYKYFDTSKDKKIIDDFFGARVFEYPKSLEMIKNFIEMATNSNDIILDFFAGSGTTAHSVFIINQEEKSRRKFICVQLPEQTYDMIDGIKIAKKESKVAFDSGYMTISEITKKRIRNAAKKIKTEDHILQLSTDDLFTKESDLGFRVFKLQKSNFSVWDSTHTTDPEQIALQLEQHIDHIAPEASQQAILFELLLKSGYELTTSIETLTLADKTVYSIADNALLICLEKELTIEVMNAIAALEPSRVIVLDEGFQNNDQLKTNSTLTLKAKGVHEFRTV